MIGPETTRVFFPLPPSEAATVQQHQRFIGQDMGLGGKQAFECVTTNGTPTPQVVDKLEAMTLRAAAVDHYVHSLLNTPDEKAQQAINDTRGILRHSTPDTAQRQIQQLIQNILTSIKLPNEPVILELPTGVLTKLIHNKASRHTSGDRAGTTIPAVHVSEDMIRTGAFTAHMQDGIRLEDGDHQFHTPADLIGQLRAQIGSHHAAVA